MELTFLTELIAVDTALDVAALHDLRTTHGAVLIAYGSTFNVVLIVRTGETGRWLVLNMGLLNGVRPQSVISVTRAKEKA